MSSRRLFRVGCDLLSSNRQYPFRTNPNRSLQAQQERDVRLEFQQVLEQLLLELQVLFLLWWLLPLQQLLPELSPVAEELHLLCALQASGFLRSWLSQGFCISQQDNCERVFISPASCQGIIRARKYETKGLGDSVMLDYLNPTTLERVVFSPGFASH